MNSIRVASLVFGVALIWAPLPAQAQGGPPGGGPGANLAERVAALEALVATLQTNLANEASARAAADSTLQTNINSEASSRAAADAALDARVAKFEGNITAADLEGTYNLYFVATAIYSGPNTISSYFIAGTMTLGSGGTGQIDVSASGSQLTERAPSMTWLAADGSEARVGNISWAYSNGRVTINDGGDINDLTPAAGGQVMIGVQGGPPGNNQIIFVLTRQP